MMAIACLSVVAALSLHRLSGRVRRVTVALAVCGLIVDGWPGRFVVWPAPPIRPSPAGVVARLDLPMTDETDPQALYQQMFDPIPLYNGFSGYVAPHYYAMRMLVEEADPRILQVMTAGGELGVVIDHAGDPDGALRRFVLSAPGSTVERVERDWSSYRLPRTVNLPAADEESGASIRITSFSASPGTVHAERALDGNLLTNWEGGSQEQPAEAVIELESPTHVGQLVIDLGRWVRDFPTRLQIDVSADGAAWHTAWTGGTALQAYYGAIRHPREMPMVFAIGRDDVRFMRLRQIGVGKHEWSIAELHVLR
jgi:hypothetical protein